MPEKQTVTSLGRYVKANYANLPKSNFNEKELVIVAEYENSEEGWGHHSYSGLGIDSDGKVFLCYSSGCSCNGSCGVDEKHVKSGKILDVPEAELPTSVPSEEEFKRMRVDFSDY